MVTRNDLATVFGRLDSLPLPVAARELALAGVPVFPCVPDGKAPLVRGGFHQATTDPHQVQRWWRWKPTANVGIPTGAASGLVVIDVDVHHVDGHAAYARAERAGLIPASLMTVTTPTGGRHAYFPADPAGEQRSWAAAKAGIDFRGDGGYIIAPPSLRLLEGTRIPYRTGPITTAAPASVDAAQLRDFLAPRSHHQQVSGARHASGREDADRLAGWLARQVKGDRNYKLFWAACRLAEGNVPVSEAMDALVRAEQPDFSEQEITRTVCSAYRRVGAAHTCQTQSVRSPDSASDGPARRGPVAQTRASRGLA
ncbi:bifunctional DNA primase/polymerase [Paramicrobacterium chengjingii]|uniref:bifunctional DNA primase/polymerase n=1 Tax=Paramicrobacterium chengjingii TaxID=2769067 RepID=UPI00141E9A61|nr:bifunctional DNA primase/polymerase [Microbacterium chengjingii]